MDLLEVKHLPLDKIMLDQLSHVCLVVSDAEKSAQLYSTLFGIGPFTLRLIHTPPSRAVLYGEPTEYTIRFAYARTGALTLELAQPVAGRSLQSEFLQAHGEGLHHLGFAAPSPLDEELAKWQHQGISPLQINRREDPRYGWAYMDTRPLVGCVLEIVCDPVGGWWDNQSLIREILPRLIPT